MANVTIGPKELRLVHGDLNAAYYGLAVTNTAAQNLAALQATMAVAIAATVGGHIRIHIPRGLYLVPPNVFSLVTSLVTSSIKFGVTFSGTGRFSTVFKLVTGGVDAWFFDNGAGHPRLQAPMWEHMGFYGDDEVHTHGWKVYSIGGDKQYNWHDCEFGKDAASAWGDIVRPSGAYVATPGACGMHTLLRTEGTANADLTTMSQCHLNILGDLLYLNNSQSVSHQFYGLQGGVRGNLVFVGASGGGYAAFHGGAIDMYDDGTTTMRYMLNIPNSAGMGIGNGDFLYVGVKVEFRDQYRGIANLASYSGHVQALFQGCGIGTTVGGDRIAIKLGSRKVVKLRDCLLHEDLNPLCQFQDSYATVIAAGGGSPQHGGILVVDGCNIGTSTEDITDRITFLGDIGRAIGRNNFSANSKAREAKITQDFDLNWQAACASDPQPVVKVVQLLPNTVGWPTGGGTPPEYTTKLPEGAMLLSIYAEKLSGGLASNYQLGIYNDDESHVYYETALAFQSGTHVVDVAPRRILTGAIDRIIRVKAKTPGTTAGGANTMRGPVFATYIG